MKNTISIRSTHDPILERVIVWEEDPTSGEWLASAFYHDPQLNYRLYDLDAVDLSQVMATTQQYMRGELPLVYLEPRGSELHRRLTPPTGTIDWTQKDLHPRAGI